MNKKSQSLAKKNPSINELSPIRDVNHLVDIISRNPLDERLNIENKDISIYDILYLNDNNHRRYVRIDVYIIKDKVFDSIYLYNNERLFIREYNTILNTILQAKNSKSTITVKYINSYKLQNILIDIV